jgi:hypothetical protein
MTREHIQHAIDIYNQIFSQGRADLLPGLVSGPYIQHNPLFPNGLDGIMAYIKQAVFLAYPKCARFLPSGVLGPRARTCSRTAALDAGATRTRFALFLNRVTLAGPS